MGFLYDNHLEKDVRRDGLTVLGLYNRGSYGTGHGWAAAHSVAWKCRVGEGELVVEKPPTAQNYAIGCLGRISGLGPFSQSPGYIEWTGKEDVLPESLYRMQLKQRVESQTATIRFEDIHINKDTIEFILSMVDGPLLNITALNELEIRSSDDITKQIEDWIPVDFVIESAQPEGDGFKIKIPLQSIQTQNYFALVPSWQRIQHPMRPAHPKSQRGAAVRVK